MSKIWQKRPPYAENGMTIGLYGGSFNPPHQGHRHVATTALRRLGLDRIWCMVTPGNPLKKSSDLQSLNSRMQAVANIMNHPRLDVTGFETNSGCQTSAETVTWLGDKFPAIRFIWIMGADNLENFHQWHDWQHIVASLPIAIVDRPGHTMRSVNGRAALVMARHRLQEYDAASLIQRDAPAWIYLHGPRTSLSSTTIRTGKP
ncbi:MAG: nicotinic acid mononucleotide adenylyltransferase [Hyphomicrobiales bacterium]|nr:MAG: nicotinic acid mononucleotide adenylyltransferase [Hyphomicrobiales bacterium]